jgi:hypothetical protein
LPGKIGQVDDRLARRVAAAHHDDVLAFAELSFHLRRGVVDAGALEVLEAGDVQLPILHPARDQHAATVKPGAVLESDDAIPTVDAE